MASPVGTMPLGGLKTSRGKGTQRGATLCSSSGRQIRVTVLRFAPAALA
jgi:hypothetical protein